ncbi:MAG: zinc-dependent peptidase [Verrucomicrobiales bacterium]|nr:zinc-dependent peptidase [Verrucomicrobiales bacterium]
MRRLCSLLLGLLVPIVALAERQRVVVLTDISNEPDDEESMVRFLVYSNEYDVEGLVATTSTWLRTKTREDLIRRQIDAYGQVRPNLAKHASGYPTREELLAVTSTGQTNYGMAEVGEGKTTAGSRRLLMAADKPDPRPLWVTVWGGANTLAQALWDARRERSASDLEKLIAKLRVYTISDQDDAGPWLRREFTNLFYIVSPSTTDSKEYWRATWTGISGDQHYKNGPGHKFALVDNPWLEANIINNHGTLGALYPRWAFIMEGDTPSFLGLIDNGLGWAIRPDYGGWGGRYVLYQAYGETRPIWTNNRESRDTVTADNGQIECTDMATVWRWREHYQHDFAARMDWCVADDSKKANHNPVVVLNGDRSKRVIELSARSGESVRLTAEGTSDPDGDKLEVRWWIYPEASTLREAKSRAFPLDVKLGADTGWVTTLVAPAVKKEETLHIICEVKDSGSPGLWSYRRAILTVVPMTVWEVRKIEGWNVHLNRELLVGPDAKALEQALTLLGRQLKEIVAVVPATAVKELQQVSLYFSPPYLGRTPTAEYHPDAGWLEGNGRDPAMAKGVEFSNVRQFEAETKRMPNFTLHELAHAYHDRVLPDGFDQAEIKAAYERAKVGGRYDRVERRLGNGRTNTFERAYAMTNPMEYFAETTEAFFGRNDFFPFTREELKAHDPEMFTLLGRLWGVASP